MVFGRSYRFASDIPHVADQGVASPAITPAKGKPKLLQTLLSFGLNLAKEPPFRLASRYVVKYLPFDVVTKACWDVVPRPGYLVGLIQATKEAMKDKIDAMCAIEFGVARGTGLLELQKYAVAVGRHFGIRIDVVGFDTGLGLPNLCGDYRDHPDLWLPGDYPMDEALLRSKLLPSTRLTIGNVADTVENFVNTQQTIPVGFISFDMDLYSSTSEALKILSLKNRNILKRVVLYFDDVADSSIYHQAAGEYLAINEFNDLKTGVFIDKWYDVKRRRPFPEAFWTNKMYIAHHLDAISKHRITGRPVAQWTCPAGE